MISLSAIEIQIAEVINDEEVEILAVAIPDSAKGEQVILLVAGDIDLAELKSNVLKSDINPLMLPKQYLAVEAIPKLGTGKADFSGAKKLVLEMV